MIEIYDRKGMTNISLSGLKRIKEILKNDEVLYITNAVKTTGSEVVKMISSINDKSLNSAIEKNENLYIRSTNKGVIRIEALKLSFNGPDDFKPLDDLLSQFGKDILEKNRTLKKLRENGDIEILSEHDVDAVSNYLKQERDIKQQKIEEAKKNNSGGGTDNEDMWSDKNPHAVSASSLGGRSSPKDNEGSLLTDDMFT